MKLKRKTYIDILTDDLGQNLQSNKDNSSKTFKLILFSLFALLSVILIEYSIRKIYLHPLRFDYAILYLLFFVGIYGIFFKSTPGQNLNWIFTISFLLILSRIIYIFYNFSISDIHKKEFFQMNHSFCPAHFLIYGVPAIFVFFFLLKSKLNTQIHFSASISILTAASFSEIVLNFFCSDQSFSHIGIWHLLSWSIPALVGILFFRKNLEW